MEDRPSSFQAVYQIKIEKKEKQKETKEEAKALGPKVMEHTKSLWQLKKAKIREIQKGKEKERKAKQANTAWDTNITEWAWHSAQELWPQI